MIEEKIKVESFSTGSFEDEPDDLSYWLSKTPEDRIEGVEFIRRQFYSYGKAEQEFRRFFEVTEPSRYMFFQPLEKHLSIAGDRPSSSTFSQ